MKTTMKTLLAIAFGCGFAMAAENMAPPENPATGIWIQQVGDIVPHASTKATLYYTKYSENDRVKEESFNDHKANGDTVTVQIPAGSVLMIRMK